MINALKILVVLALLSMAISCEVARYNECRRIHPFWYCMRGNR